ncbi:MAG TPA: hypothetical protein VHI52_16745, partial [Verrucomicrobiae bacterium]|nr:hypothetical protein [Verrucomicrobiae bacterium]
MISAWSSLPIFGPISRTRLADWADQWRAICLALSLAASAGCSGLRGADPAIGPLSVAFEHDDLGKKPRGFSTGLTGGGSPVFWAVREVPNAAGGKPVLLQESSDATSYRFPVCVYDDFVARDVAVQVRFMAISGRVDQAGGIVLRYHPDNYYVARANALEDNINLYKIVGGKRTRIKEAPLKVTAG